MAVHHCSAVSLVRVAHLGHEGAEDFYGAVVGWTVAPFDGSPRPTTCGSGGRSADGRVMGLPEGMNVPPHWGIYVGAANLEQAVAKWSGSAAAPCRR